MGLDRSDSANGRDEVGKRIRQRRQAQDRTGMYARVRTGRTEDGGTAGIRIRMTGRRTEHGKERGEGTRAGGRSDGGRRERGIRTAGRAG